MNRNLKIFFLSIGIAALLFVFIAAILPAFFNSRNHASRMEKYLSSLVGLPCNVEGRVEVFFLPKTSITFDKLTISNPEGFSANHFLQVDSGQVVVNPWKLLAGSIQVERLILSGVDVQLEKNSAGEKNWQGVRRHNLAASIDLLAVTEATLNWQNSMVDRRYHLTDFSFVMTDYQPGESGNIELHSVLNGLELNLKGKARLYSRNGMAPKLLWQGDVDLKYPDALGNASLSAKPLFLGTTRGNLDFADSFVDIELTPYNFASSEENSEKLPYLADTVTIKGSEQDFKVSLGGEVINTKQGDLSVITMPLDLIEIGMRLSGQELSEEFLMQKRVAKLIDMQKTSPGTVKIGSMEIVQ